MADHLQAVSEGHILELVINVPPRCMKSTTVMVMWPSWEWIRRPQGRWMFGAYAESLPRDENQRARRLMEGEWYQSNWGDRWAFATDQNEKTKIENDKTGYRIAVGARGSITGKGGDRLVLDDPHNMKEIHNETIRQGVIDWYNGVWYNRANNTSTTARILIMQRGHEDDLAGHILASSKNVVHLCLPMKYEGSKSVTVIGFRDPRTEDDQLMWPEHFPAEDVAKIESRGSFEFAAQYQQRPAPRGGGVWKKDWFRFYAARDLPASFDTVVDSWDCSFKDTDGSDYVCGQRWGKTGPDFYLIAQVWKKMDMPDTLKAVVDFRENATVLVNAVLIEDKANGPGVISMAKKRIPGVLGVNPEGGKMVRAHGAAPTIEAGNVYLPMPEEQPWVSDLLLEYCTFPNARHDDRVDATSQAIIWLTKNDLELFAGGSVEPEGGSSPYDDDQFERTSPWRIG